MAEITVEKAEGEGERDDTLFGRAGEAFEMATEMFERSIEAQSEFAESVSMNVESTAEGSEDFPEILEGFASAYELYAEATEEVFEKTAESYEDGEAPDISEIGGIWLDTANEATKEVMKTSGFASAGGKTTTASLDAKTEFDENRDEALRSMGVATEASITEVGERLVELERRQHEVEKKLDRLTETEEEE